MMRVIGSCEATLEQKVKGQISRGGISAGTRNGLLQRPSDVSREAVRLVESLQSDRVSAVVEWLAVSHDSCDGVVVDDVARICSYMFGRGGCRSVVQ